MKVLRSAPTAPGTDLLRGGSAMTSCTAGIATSALRFLLGRSTASARRSSEHDESRYLRARRQQEAAVEGQIGRDGFPQELPEWSP